MKRIVAVLFAASMLVNAQRAAAEYDYFPYLITLIAEMANLAVEADNCEQQLTYFARKGLESPQCRAFKKHYYSLWPDRDSLQEEILSYVVRAEQGEYLCDERCRSMLMRCEELRITIAYVLDYMEFALDY